MNNQIKILTSFLIVVLGLFVKTPVIAQEIYIDSNCKQNQRLEESDRFTLTYKAEFQTQGKTYWLYSGQYLTLSPLTAKRCSGRFLLLRNTLFGTSTNESYCFSASLNFCVSHSICF